ncbi:MAG: HAD-IA family hydrolase [Puniceicoccaceae bacterium]
MNLRIILFDFDGTIADTFSETVEIFNRFAAKYRYNRIEEHEIEKARHMNAWQLLNFVKIPKRKVPFLLRKGRSMLYRNLDRIAVFEGIHEILSWAEEHQIICGVVTSNSKKNVERFVSVHQLPNIHFVRSSSRLMGKPREFHRILKKRRIAKDEVIYIGDESRDVDAARESGIKVISVTWGYNSREALKAHRPDFIADHPEDLQRIVADLHQAPRQVSHSKAELHEKSTADKSATR